MHNTKTKMRYLSFSVTSSVCMLREEIFEALWKMNCNWKQKTRRKKKKPSCSTESNKKDEISYFKAYFA